ncbi:MAG TPA: alpha/beta hydrolase [Aggregatilineaceae bacterium]|nr:alpha/beta hydrolase [Aggregatilineaceae bacterium]
MPILEANGAAIDYVDSGGDKPALVLIHGWLGTGESEFGPEIDWLKNNYRVLAPTRRGYGRSGPQPRRYSRDFYRRDAEDLAAWLDALQIKAAHMVGFSDGGEVAILLPIIRPDLVLSVAAWGAVGYFSPDLRPYVQSKWPATWVTDAIRARHAPQPVEPIVLGWINAMKQIIDSGGNVSLNEAHQITCPLLLMLGTRDELNPPEAGRQLVERVPKGKLVLFDCGHPIHREQPERFRQTLGEHLQGV